MILKGFTVNSPIQHKSQTGTELWPIMKKKEKYKKGADNVK